MATALTTIRSRRFRLTRTLELVVIVSIGLAVLATYHTLALRLCRLENQRAGITQIEDLRQLSHIYHDYQREPNTANIRSFSRALQALENDDSDGSLIRYSALSQLATHSPDKLSRSQLFERGADMEQAFASILSMVYERSSLANSSHPWRNRLANIICVVRPLASEQTSHVLDASREAPSPQLAVSLNRNISRLNALYEVAFASIAHLDLPSTAVTLALAPAFDDLRHGDLADFESLQEIARRPITRHSLRAIAEHVLRIRGRTYTTTGLILTTLDRAVTDEIKGVQRLQIAVVAVGALLAALLIGLVESLTNSQRRRDEAIAVLESAMEGAADLIAVTDATPIEHGGPRIRYANPAYAAFFHTTLEDVAGAPITSIASPKADPRVVATIRDRLASHTEINNELLVRRLDSSADIWIAGIGRPLRDEAGTPTGWIFLGHDMSLRKQQYQQTAELTAALDTVQEAITIYNVAQDASLVQAYQNSAAAEHDRDVLFWLVQNETHRNQIDWEQLRRGLPTKQLVRFQSPVEGPTWLTLECRPVLFQSGELQSIVAIERPLHGAATRRRSNSASDAVILAEEVLSLEHHHERRDAIATIAREEYGATLQVYTHGTTDSVGLCIVSPHRNGISMVMAPGIVTENTSATIAMESEREFTERQLTALRVLLETLGEARPA